MSAVLPSPGFAVATRDIPQTETYLEYTEQQRFKAMAVFAATNNVQAAADAIGAARTTVWAWVHGDDAQDVIQRLRDSLKAHTAWEHVEIAMLAARKLKERLAEGDPHVDKDGNVTLVPVKAKDLVMALSVSTDKAIMLGGQMADAKATDSRLDKLAADILNRVDKSLKDQGVSAPAAPTLPLGDYLG